MNKSLERYLGGWIETDTASDLQEPTPVLPQPWPLEDRLSAAELLELIARYQAGATSRELADELGVGKTAVVRLLRQHGVQVRNRGPRR